MIGVRWLSGESVRGDSSQASLSVFIFFLLIDGSAMHEEREHEKERQRKNSKILIMIQYHCLSPL